MAQKVRLVARARDGRVLLERTLPGWYVLAGGKRLYDLELTAHACTELDRVSVALTSEHGSAPAEKRFEVAARCR